MKKKIKINDLIADKIDFRYGMYHQYTIDRRYTNRMILDFLYPRIVVENIIRKNSNNVYNHLTNDILSGYAISERIANDLQCKKLHISELITMLGYTKTEISKLLQQVKNKQYSIALAGVGGTGSNFLHWMYEMCEFTGKENIFKRLYAYDDDDYDVPNMLRIPFEPSFNNSFNSTSQKVDCIPHKFKKITLVLHLHMGKITEEMINNKTITPRTGVIIYGAPDIETRRFLSAGSYAFSPATHRDDEFALIENPSVDNELMMETYGKIHLTKFFMNHLLMTIKFLEHLRDRERPTTTIEEHEICRIDFNEEHDFKIGNGFKAGSKKLFVLTPNERTVEREGI